MCGIGGMISVLRNKTKGKSSGKRKGSSRDSSISNGKDSPNGRVIPPEPVQQRPDGQFEDNEAEPALQVHNLARANKSSRKLEWDNRLADDAGAYAQELAESGKLDYSGVESQGENIFSSDHDDAKFEDAVQGWLNEEKQYSGEKVGEGDNFEEWRQFAQCVWHSTTHVGMGKAKSKDGRTYVVARYTPAGNVAGGRPY